MNNTKYDEKTNIGNMTRETIATSIIGKIITRDLKTEIRNGLGNALRK